MEQQERLYLYKRIVKAKLFIDNHYSSSIDLENIADQACFSKFHFIRLFTSIYGYTPHHYLVKVRVDKAKLLLSNGCSVLETSLSVGFESPTSFSGVFKKLTGRTPSDYQREQEEKQSTIVKNPLRFVPNCFAATHGWSK